MSTTTLFVEILIIGFESLVWIGLLLSIIWNPHDALVQAKAYSEYALLWTTLLFALAYVIGIIIDRVADSVYKLFRYTPRTAPPAAYREMRFRILDESEGIGKFCEYQRSRLRISRATFLNLIILTAVFPVWLIINNQTHLLTIAGSIIAGASLVGLSYYTTYRIDKAQTEALEQAYKIITVDSEKRKKTEGVVAAVCYRHKNKGIEFLLVKTKKGKYRTFPKGHIETCNGKKESPREAAKREALEEAGVVGTEPFTRYVYRKGSKGSEYTVTAYLLRVESQQKPIERYRHPHWYLFDKALEKLSHGRREQKYKDEHVRVINEALARLQSKDHTME